MRPISLSLKNCAGQIWLVLGVWVWVWGGDPEICCHVDYSLDLSEDGQLKSGKFI